MDARRADDLTEVLKGIDSTLRACGCDRGEDLLSDCAPEIAIAAEDLPIGHGRANGMVGWPARGFEPRFLEEQEEFVAVTTQMVGQLHIGRVREVPAQQPLQARLQPTDRNRQAVAREFFCVPAAAQAEGSSEEIQDRTREAHGSSSRPFQDRPTSPLDMSHAS